MKLSPATLSDNLRKRGLLHDLSSEDALAKLGNNDAFYLGYDPTAASLHIGNLVPMMASLWAAKSGLQAIQLMGGATGSIGDPSGRSNERNLLTHEIVNANAEKIGKVVKNIFERQGLKIKIVNNYEWTKDLTALDFLREVGKHFSINVMISKDVVRNRLESDGISYTEFSYMLLQAYDFHYLRSNFNCKLQMGGSDQWGNISAGLDYVRRKGFDDAVGLSTPLLLDSQGKKFGKSQAGALWIDAELLSPYQFHQYFLNVEDRDAMKLLRLFTFLDDARLEEVQAEFEAHPEKRAAQRLLADEVCNLIHGEGATAEAKAAAEALFGGSLLGLEEKTLLDVFKEVPSSTFNREELSSLTAGELFLRIGMVSSKGESKRLIEGGGAYIMNERVPSTDTSVGGLLAAQRSFVILRTGKKNYHLVKLL